MIRTNNGELPTRRGASLKKAVAAIFMISAIAVSAGATGTVSASEAPAAIAAPAPTVTVSLITILPGEELYSSFGHTAIRVRDPERGRDRLYNYGLSAKPFDLAFAKGMLAGRMEFMVGVGRTDDVLGYYRDVENRTILEQTLNLDPERLKAMIADLELGVRGDNKYYNYRFFDNNCATKPAAILTSTLGEDGTAPAIGASRSLRSAIKEVLRDKRGLALGIDIMLGPIADRIPSHDYALFLPEDLMSWAAGARYPGQDGTVDFVSRAGVIYEAAPAQDQNKGFPLIYYFIAIVVVAISVSMLPTRLSAVRGVFDAALFGLITVPGLAIIVFWLSAGYRETGMNLNLLWAGPLPLIALILKRRERLRPAATAMFWIAALMAGLAALGGFGIQAIPAEARLAAVAVLVRCGSRAWGMRKL